MGLISYRELFNLDGKVAIVTGGGGLLGRHFCLGLAESGARIAIVDQDLEKAEEASDEVNSLFPGKAVSFKCDVSEEFFVTEMVRQVAKEFGAIDILVNNAAGKSDDLDAFFECFEDYELSQWKKIMSVNLDGMFLVAREVGKWMSDQSRGGSIIQTASIYGVFAPDQRIYEGSEYLGRGINTPVVYSSSKSAVIGMTRHLSAYWANRGIRVNSISPGGVESGQNEEFVSRYSERVPMQRMGQAHEMVGALLFLASDASSYVTGQNLVIDGGLSCW